MRIQLKKGKQRELLKKEKIRLGLTWPIFAENLGMKYGKLMTFYNEERLIDDLTYDKLYLRNKYDRFILAKHKDNWGQSKGGSVSCVHPLK